MENVYKQNYKLSKEQRQKLNNHNSFLLWFTGLSGSGKSTLADAVEIELHKKSISTYTLDGDNIRRGINKNLGFSKQDRGENIRRIAEISNLFIDAGIVVLAAFVSPYASDREDLMKTVGRENFIEIFVNTSLSECEKRDVKGLYKKARNGDINNMTGISAPYEKPKKPDIEIITDNKSIDSCVKIILKYIETRIYLSKKG